MSNRSQDPDPGGKSENGSGERGTPVDMSVQSCVFGLSSNAKPSYSHKHDPPPTQEDYRTKFYDVYRREAEEYDREFIKRYDEDLNTTLIFVRVLHSLCLRRADSGYRPVCSPP